MTESPSLQQLLHVLDAGARTREDILTGPPLPTPHGRAFGGQVLGQAIAAAGATIGADRVLHSMHAYFLRPGDSHHRMTFEVARLYDGRSFSTRRVQAYQDGEVLVSLIASFQTPSAGVEHQASIDLAPYGNPEALPTVWQTYGHLAEDRRASWVLNRPFDIRHVGGDIMLDVSNPVAEQAVWMRAREPLATSHLVHQAALAFASDYVIMEPILRRHGIPWATPGVRLASLDHSMWFHREFRVDEWLLFVMESPSAGGGRGLSNARFYREDGALVASVAQEAMLRLPEGTAASPTA